METKSLSLLEQMRAVRPINAEIPGIGIDRTLDPSQRPQAAPSFGEFLAQSIEETNQLSVQADRMMEQHVAGNSERPEATMIALQKADISFKLLISVKEKLISAYQTVMRTPIG